MKHPLNKNIDGKNCQLRDAVYSDYGAETEEDYKITLSKSFGGFEDPSKRQEVMKEVTYSWEGNPSEEGRDSNYSETEGVKEPMDSEIPNEGGLTDEELFERLLGNPTVDSSDEVTSVAIEDVEDTQYSAEDEPVDSMYSANVNTRLVFLKKPLALQLKELHRDHSRFYRSRGRKMKPSEIDLMMEDYRFELHRIIALAKNQVVETGGNVGTILRLSAFSASAPEGASGGDLLRSSNSLTILFKRIEDAYTKFNYIPQDMQIKLEKALSTLVSHFTLDVYGEELERRKSSLTEVVNTSNR